MKECCANCKLAKEIWWWAYKTDGHIDHKEYGKVCTLFAKEDSYSMIQELGSKCECFTPKTKPQGEYIDKMSDSARNLLESRLDEGKKNIYHSMMALIDKAVKNDMLVLDCIFTKCVIRNRITEKELEPAREIFNQCIDTLKKRYGYEFIQSEKWNNNSR